MGTNRVLSPTDPIAEATIALNTATIHQIPQSALSDAAARNALVELASAGVEVYAYESAGSHQTTIWLRPFTADIDGRMTCAEWQRIYQQEATAEVLVDLIQQLYTTHNLYTSRSSDLADDPRNMELRHRVEASYQRRRELEQRIRLVQWRLSAPGCAA